jgi:DNA-binding transcriptional regulator YhcF (GntR family)
VLLQLDFGSDEPIYQQLRNQIVRGIADGRLAPGERLPTIRALALEAGINMMTASKAYSLLKQEGFITAERRYGAVVSVAARAGELTKKSVDALRVIASEAKLAGLSESAFTSLCARLFDGKGETL